MCETIGEKSPPVVFFGFLSVPTQKKRRRRKKKKKKQNKANKNLKQ
jgi:hypothetical protein